MSNFIPLIFDWALEWYEIPFDAYNKAASIVIPQKRKVSSKTAEYIKKGFYEFWADELDKTFFKALKGK